MSVNISQLLAEESDPEDFVGQLQQDLTGVETDFKFQSHTTQVEGLKFDERNIRVAKARKRLQRRKQKSPSKSIKSKSERKVQI